MNVVDSTGWIEYLTDGRNAQFFAPSLEARDQLIVPTIVVYEVIRWVLHKSDEDVAARSLSEMTCGHVVDLDTKLAVDAAQIARRYRLAMADAIILATARRFDAGLWTQDADFKGIDSVHYVSKPA